MTNHQCDPSTSTLFGGWVNYNRLIRYLEGIVDRDQRRLEAILHNEIGACQTCWLALTYQLTGMILNISPQIEDFRMTVEMRLASSEAALARGDIDLPPDEVIFGLT